MSRLSGVRLCFTFSLRHTTATGFRENNSLYLCWDHWKRCQHRLSGPVGVGRATGQTLLGRCREERNCPHPPPFVLLSLEWNCHISWEGDDAETWDSQVHTENLLIGWCTRPWKLGSCSNWCPRPERKPWIYERATRPIKFVSLGNCSKWQFQGRTNELINYSHFTHNMVWFFLLSWIR